MYLVFEPSMPQTSVSTQDVEAQLEKILSSGAFTGANRPSRLLRFIVQQTLAGTANGIKEYLLGVEVLGRKPSFDPRIDPIVRAEVGRLRSRLLEYYASEGKQDRVRICLAKGTYVPEFEWNTELDRAAKTRRETQRRKVYWLVTAVGVLLLMGLGLAHLVQRSANRAGVSPPVRFLLYPPERTQFALFGYGGPVRVSPDGRRIAFVAIGPEGNQVLWVRSLDSVSAQALAGTEGASAPFWSPNSRFLGFFAREKLYKVDIFGGGPQALCDAQRGAGGAWNRDGTIVFAPDDSTSLYRIPATGGVPVAVTTLDRSHGIKSHRSPEFLSDGHHFLYLAFNGKDVGSAIYVGSLDSRVGRQVLAVPSNVAYAPSRNGELEYLLYVRGRALMAQAFEARRFKVSGEPFVVASRVAYETSSAIGDFSVSTNGVLVYRSDTEPTTQLVSVNRQGKQIAKIGRPGRYSFPELSADEQRIATMQYDAQTGLADIWLLDLSRNVTSRLTVGPADSEFPVWSPDGSQILFDSVRNGTANLYVKASNGASREKLLLGSPATKYPNDWSADGRFVLFEQRGEKTGQDLWAFPLHGGQKPFPFLETEFQEKDGRLSPGGHWIAYTSDKSGKDEIYVRSFPAVRPDSRQKKGLHTSGEWQISTSGGGLPRWRRDGKELFYLSEDLKMMAVEIKGDSSTFNANSPRVLFDVREAGGMSGFPCAYSVASNGQRFIITAGVEQGTSVPITVVLNWMSGL